MSVADALTKVLGKSKDSAEDRPPASSSKGRSSLDELADLAWDAAKDDDREAFDEAFKSAVRSREPENDEA